MWEGPQAGLGHVGGPLGPIAMEGGLQTRLGHVGGPLGPIAMWVVSRPEGVM